MKEVVAFEVALHSYMDANHSDLMQCINANGDYNSEIESALSKALDGFKQDYTW